ncbi:TraR/DksA family transcriptional regulator [Pseudoduganella flava]|uniref:TraR/DksA family transcriptional regulator n=1 Tax=Pseudoduganella flava TaxID=871742 RepID=A0A562PQV5_9BURK|nr:TraR/DksA C4-type zinc finger protein [Pseudoduganella flava]QGZ37930.1 TraR/DksA family transcriptional regulator [Pseudoduganella flava]TWI46768.1 TraR/DksA family transcriptional regulator [Pseudoduganella flava]
MSLTTAQTQALGTDLRRRRDLLAAELRERLHTSGQDVPAGLRDYLGAGVDPSEAYEELADDLAWLGHETIVLRRLDAALRRLSIGGYGTCIYCGGDIPPERLQAMPAAESCVACQEAAERERRRHPA